jgi:transposase-like protein
VIAVEVVNYQDTSGRRSTGGHADRTLKEGFPERHARGSKPPVSRKRAGRVRMAVIPDASAASLMPFVAQHVAPGSTIYTDGWPSYNGLGAAGYKHVVTKQSESGKSTDKYLPMVHVVISNLKRWLLGTYKGAVLPHHLPAYLNEFTYRFNRRFWKAPSFLRALGLSAAPSRPRLEYRKLYAVGKGGEWHHPNPRSKRKT